MNKVEIAFQRGYQVDKDGAVHGILVDVLSAPPNAQGYRCFTLRTGGGKIRNIRVHRLQAYQKFGQEMFQEGVVVRHLNGDKLDNSWDNIAIGTASDNMMDIPADIRHARAVQRGRTISPLSVENVLEMRRLYEEGGWTHARLAERFGVARSSVSFIICRERWSDI